MFIGGFIVAGLDFRYKWFILPQYITYIFSIVFFMFLGVVEYLDNIDYLSFFYFLKLLCVDISVCRVLFDELAAWLYIIAHEH